jgi:hypothetical protein
MDTLIKPALSHSPRLILLQQMLNGNINNVNVAGRRASLNDLLSPFSDSRVPVAMFTISITQISLQNHMTPNKANR